MLDHISYTQINTYLSCPLKYNFQYIERIPWPFKPEALIFGSAIHQSLEHYYTGRKESRNVPINEMLALYDASWEKETSENEIRFKNGNTRDSLLKTAESMLETFLKTVKPGEILAIEQSFSEEIIDPETNENLGVPLKGRIDLIERTKSGIAVIDHKTAAKSYDDERVANDLQLTAYSYVMSRQGHDPEDITLRFDVLMKNGKCAFQTYQTFRTPKDHARLFKTAKSVIQGIKAEAFYPQKSWMCNGCVFERECEKW
ncbi:MAG: PD-(D/E)XK nuclease family protein [Candidatus Latescibacteria bacterium]|jgi:putative RecB family exonuclease|nr:PD-(D/E)XK nuclease family protein [Candidatus Latescibacterota bacterium]